MQVSDYRLTIKARNNRILSRIEEAGFRSVSAFCQRFGLHYQGVINIIGMQNSATRKDGAWTKITMDLATALRVQPELLFTERQAGGLARSTIVRNVDEEEMLSISSPETMLLAAPQEAVDDQFSRKEAVRLILDKLDGRDRRVITRRFGLDGEPASTLGDLAAEFGTQTERVRQIENLAIRRIQGSPKLMRELRMFAGAEAQRRARAARWSGDELDGSVM
jgi:hypothetical protein